MALVLMADQREALAQGCTQGNTIDITPVDSIGWALVWADAQTPFGCVHLTPGVYSNSVGTGGLTDVLIYGDGNTTVLQGAYWLVGTGSSNVSVIAMRLVDSVVHFIGSSRGYLADVDVSGSTLWATAHVVIQESSDIGVLNFSIRDGTAHGIHVAFSDNVTIENGEIDHAGVSGIHIERSYLINVSRVWSHHNGGSGVRIVMSADCQVRDSESNDSCQGCSGPGAMAPGIAIDSSVNVAIKSNHVYNNNDAGIGVSDLDSRCATDDPELTCSPSPAPFCYGLTSSIMARNILIENNDCHDNLVDIGADGADLLTIRNNDVGAGNQIMAIFIQWTKNFSVYGNDVHGSVPNCPPESPNSWRIPVSYSRNGQLYSNANATYADYGNVNVTFNPPAAVTNLDLVGYPGCLCQGGGGSLNRERYGCAQSPCGPGKPGVVTLPGGTTLVCEQCQ